MLRTFSRSDVPAVLVQVVNARDDVDDANARELKIAVPCWMLDQTACSVVVVQEKPRLRIEALLQLRGLVDRLVSAVAERQPESHGSNAKGDRHATKNRSAAHDKAASKTTDA